MSPTYNAQYRVKSGNLFVAGEAIVMKGVWVFISCIVGLAVLPATAGFKSANDLWDHCTARERDRHYQQDNAMCMGYIVGIADVLDDGDNVDGLRACLPRGATIGQVVDTAMYYIRDNPQDRHYSASSVVAAALAAAFPCR